MRHCRTISRKSTLAAALAFIVTVQLVIFLNATKWLHNNSKPSSSGEFIVDGTVRNAPQRGNETNPISISYNVANPRESNSIKSTVDEADGKANYYQCFPPRTSTGKRSTIVYLNIGHLNLHSETFYSFIHRLCTCDATSKEPIWTIRTNSLPEFYIGPADKLSSGFQRVLEEFNKTTCGPIYFGTPPKNTDGRQQLTIVTTSYPKYFAPSHPLGYYNLINNPRYVFICHEDPGDKYALLEENATNVYFLTPKYKRYIVPSYFPPTLVQRYSKSLHDINPNDTPVMFLVIGNFNNPFRRNLGALAYQVKRLKERNFIVRFLGGASGGHEHMHDKLLSKFDEEVHSKIEFLPRRDTDEFMRLVGEADVILPLVAGGAFRHKKGYQGGKKLTSSIMWGLGFNKRMVIYLPLARVFGIMHEDERHFLYDDPIPWNQTFTDALTRCLDSVGEQKLQRRLA